MNNQITIGDIIEERGDICDIKHKDKALPIGLIIENYKYIEPINYNENYSELVDDILFNNLLKNEKRRKIKTKTKKRKPIKLCLTLKKK